MKLETFTKQVSRKIKEYMPYEYQDMEYSVVEATKNNGEVRIGLRCSKKGNDFSPILYLEPYYEEVRRGLLFESVMRCIAEGFQEAWDECGRAEEIDLKDYKKVEARLSLMLVNTEKNQGILEGVIHREMVDLSAIVRIRIETQNGEGSARVTKKLADLWEIGEEELFRTAISNLESQAEIKTISEVMEEICGEPLYGKDTGEEMFYILTNKDEFYGAAVLYLPAVRRWIKERFPGGVYILPSSVHEVLLVPKRNWKEAEELRKMVQEINRKEVAKEEVLSDRIYEYEEGEIRIVIPRPVLRVEKGQAGRR